MTVLLGMTIAIFSSFVLVKDKFMTDNHTMAKFVTVCAPVLKCAFLPQATFSFIETSTIMSVVVGMF